MWGGSPGIPLHWWLLSLPLTTIFFNKCRWSSYWDQDIYSVLWMVGGRFRAQCQCSKAYKVVWRQATGLRKKGRYTIFRWQVHWDNPRVKPMSEAVRLLNRGWQLNKYCRECAQGVRGLVSSGRCEVLPFCNEQSLSFLGCSTLIYCLIGYVFHSF